MTWCWSDFGNGGTEVDLFLRQKIDDLMLERRTRQASPAARGKFLAKIDEEYGRTCLLECFRYSVHEKKG